MIYNKVKILCKDLNNMNFNSLLNVINVVIKNEENFGKSSDEIFSLFKKYCYEENIEILKLDLSDKVLSNVADGKISKITAVGAVVALTCLPMGDSKALNTSEMNQKTKYNFASDYISKPAE